MRRWARWCIALALACGVGCSGESDEAADRPAESKRSERPPLSALLEGGAQGLGAPRAPRRPNHLEVKLSHVCARIQAPLREARTSERLRQVAKNAAFERRILGRLSRRFARLRGARRRPGLRRKYLQAVGHEREVHLFIRRAALSRDGAAMRQLQEQNLHNRERRRAAAIKLRATGCKPAG